LPCDEVNEIAGLQPVLRFSVGRGGRGISWVLRITYFQSGRNGTESSTRSMIGGARRRGGPLLADRHEGRVLRNTVPDYGTDAARTKDRVRLVPARIVKAPADSDPREGKRGNPQGSTGAKGAFPAASMANGTMSGFRP
jgi:hypothetical protein